MLVQRPGRQSNDVAFTPDEAFPIDDRRPFALNDMVNGAACMAMRFCRFAWAKHLRPAGHRRHHWAAGLRMAIFECNAVEGTSLVIAERSQCVPRPIPRVKQ